MAKAKTVTSSVGVKKEEVKVVVIKKKYYEEVPQNDRDGKGKFEYTNSSR